MTNRGTIYFWRQAASLLRQQGITLLLTTGLSLLPLAAVKTLSHLLQNEATAPWRTGWPSRLGNWSLSLVIFATTMMTSAVAILAVARALSSQPVSPMEAWRQGIARARPVFSALLGCALPMLGWAILLLLPLGIVYASFRETSAFQVANFLGLSAFLIALSVRVAFLLPVAVIEQVGGGAAYERNVWLSRKRVRTVTAVLGPVIFLGIASHDLVFAVPELPLQIGFVTIIQWMVLPLHSTLTTLLYLDLRARKDPKGYDGEALASDLTGERSTASAPAASL